MKFPNHIILDVSKSQTSKSSQYWIFKYIFSIKKNNLNFLKNPFTFKNLISHKEKNLKNTLLENQIKFTLTYNLSNPTIFLNDIQKTFNKKFNTPKTESTLPEKLKAGAKRIKDKNKYYQSKFIGHDIYNFLSNPTLKYDEKTLKRIIANFSSKNNTNEFKSNKLWTLFNINFLRKERIYTKLKYSRVPQYDIVSGGAAALLAGFLGFLITEKFGFELVDSGDFYFLFMYFVFFFIHWDYF